MADPLITDEIVEAVADALLGEDSGYCGPGYGSCGQLVVGRDYAHNLARIALDAAVSLLRAAIAEEIAECIKAAARLRPRLTDDAGTAFAVCAQFASEVGAGATADEVKRALVGQTTVPPKWVDLFGIAPDFPVETWTGERLDKRVSDNRATHTEFKLAQDHAPTGGLDTWEF